MQNLHRHTSFSNIFTPDSAATNEEYAKRAVELGHKVISSVEHGWAGYYFQTFELAKKYNLKFVFGAEAYWVKDREKEYFSGTNKKGEDTYAKDRGNHHILLLAKNENGRQAINDILSEANISGYYFRPRVDIGLLLSLPPDDVVVTTACIAFNGYDDIDDIIEQLHNHFKNNFYLEIQYHNTEKQKEWNKHLDELSEKLGIELIVGLDSHYIYESDAWKRDAILEAKGVFYEDEKGWFMDYPDDETVMNRFLAQNVFSRSKIQKAMDNTDIALTFDDYDNVPIFSKEIKLPTLYPNLTTEEKNKLYRKLIGKKFLEYTKNVPKSEYQRYYDGTKAEIQTYEDTGMVDYPLLDYEIVKDAVEHGGLITDTGRGCFTGDALIHTDKGLKKISDVKIGDKVIDKNGVFRNVVNTMSYEINEPLISIEHDCEANSIFPSICTEDHEIYIRGNGYNEWIKAKNLSTYDYVCVPKLNITQEECDNLIDYNIFGIGCPEKIFEKYPQDKNYWYLPIKKIRRIPKIKTTVYDLTVEKSHSYLLNNMIVHNSAVGYFTNTLCGFSKVDRFTSAIKLYPERFISTTRILETHSLPDIDLNVGTPEIFEESQVRILGQDHVYPMIAFGTLKKKSAFKLYAKAEGLDFALANEISEQIGDYDEAVKKADEEEKDQIDIYDFVDKAYEKYIEKSSEYWGIISDKKKAPSAYLLYQGNIRKEIGLIKCKSESTKKEYITCCIDGAIAENYKFLKNDILKVDVVLLIDKVFKRIGIRHFGVNELIEKVSNDPLVWKLYEDGYTVGLNQVEQDGSRKKCMNYKPKNVSELSAFVAAIRPGFKSMYKRFEEREDFSWGIPSLDNLIRTEELPVSFLFFQEQVMSVLNYAGFPMDECYGIIKAIAKKHPEKVKPLKQKFIDGFKDRIINDENMSENEALENAEKVWTIVNDNCFYGFNCVSGSTKIIKGAKNGKFVPTVEEMYNIMNSYRYAKNTGHMSLYKKYRRLGYGQSLSLFQDNKLKPNTIVGIYKAGVQQTYKVETESGCYLICTKNHRFPTPNGKKRLDELKIGDYLYCKGEYKHKYFDTSLFDTKKVGSGVSVIYRKAKERNRKNRNCCDICGKPYSENERFELHHIDFNRHNNSDENYSWLCCSCHKKIHYQHGRNKRYGNGIPTYLSKIISIEPYKMEMTYDIEMASPAHTFVSESGLVTSNSAHAYCMALDSLYQAWQKAHYPYEFYETLLQHYSNKGNKAKVSSLKSEMKKGFGIREGEYKFRNDNRSFASDQEKGVIYPSLASIKNVSQKTADSLYKLREKHYESFVDLLIDTKREKINSRQMDILIKIDYFSEFGEISKLLKIVEIFETIYDKSQIKKDKVAEIGIPENLISQYAGKETEKLFSNVNMIGLLRDYEKIIPYEKTTLYQKAYYQFNKLGYIDIVDKSCARVVVALSVNAKYSPRLSVYALANGNTITVKVPKPQFRKNPIEEGDVIRVLTQRKKQKVRMKDDGSFEPVEGVFDWWIMDYEKIGVKKEM